VTWKGPRPSLISHVVNNVFPPLKLCLSGHTSQVAFMFRSNPAASIRVSTQQSINELKGALDVSSLTTGPGAVT